MITKIIFKNGLIGDIRTKKMSIDFKPGVNIIIGPNKSGKSELFKIMTSPINKNLYDAVYTVNGFLFYDCAARKSDYNMDVIETALKIRKEHVVLLDHLHMSYNYVEIFIKMLNEIKNKQIIIATHDPFLIFQPNVNIIEMEDGYYDKLKQDILELSIIPRNKLVNFAK